MKYQAELLNCLVYKDKNSGESVTRLSYKLRGNNYVQDSEKFKGYSELSYFSNGTSLFDKMKKEFFGVPCEIEIIEKPSKSNPLKKNTVLKSIKVANELIDLL